MFAVDDVRLLPTLKNGHSVFWIPKRWNSKTRHRHSCNSKCFENFTTFGISALSATCLRNLCSSRVETEQGAAATHGHWAYGLAPWKHCLQSLWPPQAGNCMARGRNRLRQLCALFCGQALGLTEKLVGCSTWRSLWGSNKGTAGLDIPLYCKIIWRWTLMYRKILYSQYYWPAANLKACGIPLSGSIPKQWPML